MVVRSETLWRRFLQHKIPNSHNTANIIKLLTILIIIFRLLLALKCAVRDIIQSQDWLVGILDDQILAVLNTKDLKVFMTMIMFPTCCCMMMSRMHLTTPQALSMFRLICCPNSTGLNCWVPRMT